VGVVVLARAPFSAYINSKRLYCMNSGESMTHAKVITLM
jgi:hypothetical protein